MGPVPALCAGRGTICTHRRWRELHSRSLWRGLKRVWRKQAGAFCLGRQYKQLDKGKSRVTAACCGLNC